MGTTDRDPLRCGGPWSNPYDIEPAGRGWPVLGVLAGAIAAAALTGGGVAHADEPPGPDTASPFPDGEFSFHDSVTLEPFDTTGAFPDLDGFDGGTAADPMSGLDVTVDVGAVPHDPFSGAAAAADVEPIELPVALPDGEQEVVPPGAAEPDPLPAEQPVDGTAPPAPEPAGVSEPATPDPGGNGITAEAGGSEGVASLFPDGEPSLHDSVTVRPFDAVGSIPDVAGARDDVLGEPASGTATVTDIAPIEPPVTQRDGDGTPPGTAAVVDEPAEQPVDGTALLTPEAAGAERPGEQVGAPDPGGNWISPETVVAVGAGGAALAWARSTLSQLAERIPGTAVGQSAKAASTTVDEVQLQPRQERALHALNTDPIRTLAAPDTLLSTMEGPARTLARNSLSELGWGGLSLAAGAAGAPGGLALQVPLIAVAKSGQKEILDPAIDRLLAPQQPSTVVAGPDGTMAGPGARTELQNPLREPTSSSPIDNQLTQVDGRPLTRWNSPLLTTADGRPLTAPNDFQRFVDGISAQQPDAVTIYGADGGPVRDGSALLGVDGRPLTSAAPGSVLRPTTTFGGAELADVVSAPGRTQAAALSELGIPTAAELRTTLPADADPAVFERRAVDVIVDRAGAQRASASMNALPDDLSGASWTRTAGVTEPSPALSRSTVAAMVGEGAKQAMRATLTATGVPSSAATAVEAGAAACVAAACGAVGRAAEEAVQGSDPSGRSPALQKAARADFAATVARSVTTLAPDELLTVGAATGTRYLAGRVPDLPSPTGPSRVGGAGAVVAGLAAPFVRQGLVDAGVLPQDPLRSDWRGQTATVAASMAEGAAGGLTSRGDALTGAIGNGINSFRRDTTAGRRLDAFARSTPTASEDPVGDRSRAAGSAMANRMFQVGNLVETIPNAFTSTGQLLGTVLAAGWDRLDGGYTMPLSEYAAELNEMSGPSGTRRALQEVADTEARFDRNRREVVVGLPQRPTNAPGGRPWCASSTASGCVRPGSVNPDDPNSVGQLQQGRLEPGHPRYAAAVAAGRAGDQSRPWMPAYGQGPAGVGKVGPLYVGDGSKRDGLETFARNMTTPGGIQHNVTTAVNGAIDHVRRDPMGAAVAAFQLLLPHFQPR